MNREYMILGSTSVVSLAVGAGVSYLVTKKVLTAKYDELMKEEIAATKRFYSQLNKREGFSDPVALAKSIDEETAMKYEARVTTLDYGVEGLETSAKDVRMAQESIEESVTTRNIFTDAAVADEDFNYDEELANRSSDRPYVISHDEFYENAPEHNQITLEYFEDDDVLCDEGNAPINDTDGTVGDVNLNRFGHGSKDNNVVYIRNERLDVDYEVVRNKGNYVKDVLGFIEHSDDAGRPRKFRREYE